jgi:Tol biopolymer transport system component
VSPRLLLFSDAAPRPREIAWFDQPASSLARIAEPGDYWQVRLSADDRLAAITLVDPLLRTLDVFVAPASGSGEAQPLTRALAADSDPVWSPDGRTVAFRSMQSGRPGLFTRRVGIRGGADAPLTGSIAGDTATDWRGPRVLVHAQGAGATGTDVVIVDLRAGSRTPVAADPFNETDARWSPDGAWIAYVSDQSGQPDVYVVGDGRPSTRARVSFAGGAKPRWSRDGRSIFFVRGSRIMRAERLPGDLPRFAAAMPVFDAAGLRDFDTAHRSDRLVVLIAAPGSRAPAASAIVAWQTPAGR